MLGPLFDTLNLALLIFVRFSLNLYSYRPLDFLFFIFFACFRKDPYSARPFEGLSIVDVGCGGGILSEVYNVSSFLF